MNYALVYHWWNDAGIRVINDQRNPILQSIATIRFFETDLPIYVIDISKAENDWENYPEMLNINIVKKQSYFHNEKHNHLSLNLLSRIWDICDIDIPQDALIFTDSDVFWLKPILPLLGLSQDPNLDYFHCKSNNGVFYYRRDSTRAKDVIKHWKEKCLKCKNDPTHLNDIYKKLAFDKNKFKLQDEVLINTVQKNYPELFIKIKSEENNIIFSPCQTPKNIHAIASLSGLKRSRIIGLIEELRFIVGSMIGLDFLDLDLEPVPYKQMLSKIAYISQVLEVDRAKIKQYIGTNLKC